MPSTYTTNGGIELPANGEQSGTWGETVNDNMAIIDRLTNGVGAVSLSGTTHTLTTADGTLSDGQYNVLVLGGSPSGTNTITISPNDGEHVYIVKNASGQTATFTQGSGANVSVLNNTTKIIYADGAGAGAAVVDITGALDLGSLIIAGTSVTATAAELNLLDGSIAGTVVNSKAVIYGAAGQVEATTVEFDNLSGTGAVSVTNILDEDNMASDSATALATQQSIKAYVDAQVDTVDTLAEILAIGNTTGATDIAVDSAQKVQFRDAAIYINSSVDGQLDIVADTEIQIAATTIDLNGNLDVSGTLGVTGVLTATSLDISGDIDVDGTSNLDILDVDGAANFAADVTLADGADLITASAGTSNLRLGVNAGNSILSGGNYNVVVGDEAGTAITTADNNVAVGFEALKTATTAGNNTALGFKALRLNTSGNANVAVGVAALAENTTAVDNTAVGYNALGANTTGDRNTALGKDALASNVDGDRSVAVGYDALSSQDPSSNADMYNVGVGYAAGASVTTGTNNTLIGGLAGDAITTGGLNVALGASALSANTTTSYNTAVGYQSLYSNTGDAYSTAVGAQSLYTNTTGAFNNAFGRLALYSNTTGSNNTAIGQDALTANTTASSNTAIGYQAGYTGTTAANNTYLGYWAGYLTTTGSTNTFLGYGAGSSVSTGGKNTILGGYNGNQGGLDIRTSSNNIVLSDGDGNPRVIVDSSGNVLVGKTAQNTSTVGAEFGNSGWVAASRDGNTAGFFNRATSDGEIVRLTKDGTTVGSIGIGAGALGIGKGTGNLGFFDASAVPMGNISGGASDGVITLGNAGRRFKDLYLSGGVYLGGTVAANYLDDYEEGSFVPVLADATTGGNTSPTVFTGKYTKIGRLVHVSLGMFNIDTTGMTSGNGMYVRGLPFTATGLVNSQGSCTLDRINFTGFVSAQVAGNAAYLFLNDMVDSALEILMLVSSITVSGGSDMSISATYMTDA